MFHSKEFLSGVSRLLDDSGCSPLSLRCQWMEHCKTAPQAASAEFVPLFHQNTLCAHHSENMRVGSSSLRSKAFCLTSWELACALDWYSPLPSVLMSPAFFMKNSILR